MPCPQEPRFGARPRGAAGVEDRDRQLDPRTDRVLAARLALVVHVDVDVAQRGQTRQRHLPFGGIQLAARDGQIEPLLGS